MTDAASASPAACLNCGHPFGQPRPKFCPACGQESNVLPPTVGEFMQQFGGAYFATEGALWRTLKLLLFKPGELTRLYLAGRRKHYVLPLRLYLSISLVALLLMRVSGTINFAGVDDPATVANLPAKPRAVQIELGGGRAGLKDGVFFCERLPVWLCRRLQSRIDVAPQAMVQQMRLVSDRIASHWGATMFVLMPAFALGLKGLYRRRGLRYTEHLVFALHLHAFWFFVLACMMVDNTWVTTVGALAIPAYALLAMRRVYGGRWWPLLLRAVLLSIVYAVLMAVTVGVVALIALLA
jgi:hypothetical protein